MAHLKIQMTSKKAFHNNSIKPNKHLNNYLVQTVNYPFCIHQRIQKLSNQLSFCIGGPEGSRPRLSPLQRLGLGTASPCRLLAAYGSGVRLPNKHASMACLFIHQYKYPAKTGYLYWWT